MGTSPVINFVQYFDLLLYSVICCFTVWFVVLQCDLLFLICWFTVWFVVFNLLFYGVICCFKMWFVVFTVCFVVLKCDLLFYSVISWLSVRFVVLQFVLSCFTVWFVVFTVSCCLYSVISCLSVWFVVLQCGLLFLLCDFLFLQWFVVFTVWLVVCQCDLLFHMSLFLCITHFVHYYNSNSVPKIQKVYRKFPRKQIPWNSHRPTPDGAVHGPDGTTHITSLHRTLKKKLKKSGYVDLCLYCKI